MSESVYAIWPPFSVEDDISGRVRAYAKKLFETIQVLSAARSLSLIVDVDIHAVYRDVMMLPTCTQPTQMGDEV